MGYIDAFNGFGMVGGIVGGVTGEFQIDMLSGALEGRTYLGEVEFDPDALMGNGIEYLTMTGDPVILTIQYNNYTMTDAHTVSEFPTFEFTDGAASGLNAQLSTIVAIDTRFTIHIHDGSSGVGLHVDYEIETSNSVETGTGVVTFIPAPASASLLSIAALVGTRRRRS